MLPIYTWVITYFTDYLPSLNTQTPHTIAYVYIAVGCMLLVALTVILKHKDNIKRIINGTEKRQLLRSNGG